jgi:hypothetical protein
MKAVTFWTAFVVASSFSILAYAEGAGSIPELESFQRKVDNPSYAIPTLKKEEAPAEITGLDFAPLLKPRREFLGFIGKNYKRLRIKFTSVKKTGESYAVIGSTTVDGRKTGFAGTITPIQNREYAKIRDTVDMGKTGDRNQGLFFAKYHFVEDASVKFAGVFDGYLISRWRITKKGKLAVETADEPMSDYFSNNGYAGTWTANGETVSKPANWGEDRIPESGDLDHGSGEFGFDEKYIKQGWSDKAGH